MLLAASDILRLQEHLTCHHAENGAGGHYFMGPQHLEVLLASYDVGTWELPTSTRCWRRAWGWLDEDGNVRAHVVISGNPAAPWRATIAVGVEALWRRQGHGRKLMAEALAWASEERPIDWVDSWTFAHNTPALLLHRELGFSEVGRVPDVARVGARSFAQVLLLIDLRREGGSAWH
jgi:GNAT superfamily N-acetyltransferase